MSDLSSHHPLRWDPRWRRIAILGAYAAGKTTLADQLAEATGLPVIHLDSLLFTPHRTKIGPAVWADQHHRAIQAEDWILDGNILDSGGIDERLDRADVAIIMVPPVNLLLLKVRKRQGRRSISPSPSTCRGKGRRRKRASEMKMED